jgi:hypothetical protein
VTRLPEKAKSPKKRRTGTGCKPACGTGFDPEESDLVKQLYPSDKKCSSDETASIIVEKHIGNFHLFLRPFF